MMRFRRRKTPGAKQCRDNTQLSSGEIQKYQPGDAGSPLRTEGVAGHSSVAKAGWFSSDNLASKTSDGTSSAAIDASDKIAERQAGASATLAQSPRDVAQVVGLIDIPQISVGRGSPDVEPIPIGAEFRSMPFRPDLVVDGWSSERMTVRGASMRGHLHRYNGAPRQDDFAIHQLPDGRVIALVADGVSQADQSHLGATAAVRHAAKWLLSQGSVETANTDWLALVQVAAWGLVEQARVLFNLDGLDSTEAEKRLATEAEERLATTLICAVIEPKESDSLRAFVIGVGDSGAWVLRDGQFLGVLGGKSENEGGISSSAVSGLPRVPQRLEAAVTEIGPGDVLLLGTDGIGDPLGNGSGGVGNLFRELLGGEKPPSLIEFAHAIDFSRETFDDDRTLIAVTPRVLGLEELASSAAAVVEQ